MKPGEVPANAITIRLTPQTRARLDKLVNRLSSSQTAVVNLALAHLLATLEKGQPLYTVPPSEEEPKPERPNH